MLKYCQDFVLIILLMINLHGASGCPPIIETMEKPPGSSSMIGMGQPDGGVSVIHVGGVARSIPDYIGRMSPGYMFSVMDADKDDSLDACEWMQALMTKDVRPFVEFLDLVDDNGDGVMQIKEFEALVTKYKNGEIPKKENKKGDE